MSRASEKKRLLGVSLSFPLFVHFVLPISLFVLGLLISYTVLFSEKRSSYNSWPGVKGHFFHVAFFSLEQFIMMNDVTRRIREVRVEK